MLPAPARALIIIIVITAAHRLRTKYINTTILLYRFLIDGHATVQRSQLSVISRYFKNGTFIFELPVRLMSKYSCLLENESDMFSISRIFLSKFSLLPRIFVA